jgi:P-loop Domain of unknown function (DUF2791)
MSDHQAALDSRLARHIIETVGAYGIAPSRGASYFNVGNKSLLEMLDQHYLSSYLADGGAVFKLVVGDYGAGKSHFLYCLRDLAWERRFAVSKVDLNATETAYADQKRVYTTVVANILWVDTADGDETRGIGNFLEGTLARLLQAEGGKIGNPDGLELPMVAATLDSLQLTLVDNTSFKNAVIAYLRALIERRKPLAETLLRWLSGDDITTEDKQLIKTVGVTDKITKNNAFRMLRSLCQIVRALSYTGLVLLFDEGDRSLSISKKAEKTATDNLREVIDRCRDELPGTMFVYAVPPEFIKDVVSTYPALQQRLQTTVKFSRANPFSPIINLDKLELPESQLLEAIGQKLLPIFETAYGTRLSYKIQLANIAHLVAAAARQGYLTTHQRRLFVKSVVTLWASQRNREYAIDAEKANDLIRNADQDVYTGDFSDTLDDTLPPSVEA